MVQSCFTHSKLFAVHENDWLFMAPRYSGVSKDPCTAKDAQAEGELRPPGAKSLAATGAN